MNTNALLSARGRSLVAAAVVAAMLAGCSTLSGRPATPLVSKRDEPGVVLCMSEQTSGGGIRIVGRFEKGIYPVTRVTLEYRTATPSDAAPTTVGPGGRLMLANARAERITYRKGSDEVSFSIAGDAARSLRGKVLWYRWIVEYDRNGSMYNDVTDVHRTSLEEAGLPRAPGSPGPDSSIALPTTRRR